MEKDKKIINQQVDTIIKQALEQRKYRYSEQTPGEDFVLGFRDDEKSWLVQILLSTNEAKDPNRLHLFFQLNDLQVDFAQKNSVMEYLNAINQKVFMGHFFLSDNFKISFEINVDFTSLTLNTEIIKRWIDLGNASISNYYSPIKDLAQRTKND